MGDDSSFCDMEMYGRLCIADREKYGSPLVYPPVKCSILYNYSSAYWQCGHMRIFLCCVTYKKEIKLEEQEQIHLYYGPSSHDTFGLFSSGFVERLSH